MRKKRMLTLAVLSLVILGGILVALVLLVKHEPGFYERALIPAGKDRKELSTKCFGLFVTLGNCMIDPPREKWDVTFSEAQINSFFEEEFVRLGEAESLRKQGLSDPRIALEDDCLRLAFRYGSGTWSTVISYDFKIWLAPKEPNVVCVEILGRHAGALPITSQSLLNEISDVAGRRGVEVIWYRKEGNPVALVRFPSDRGRPNTQLRRLEVRDGLIAIGGEPSDPPQVTTLPNLVAPSGN